MEGYIPAQPYIDIYKTMINFPNIQSEKTTHQSVQGLVYIAA